MESESAQRVRVPDCNNSPPSWNKFVTVANTSRYVAGLAAAGMTKKFTLASRLIFGLADTVEAFAAELQAQKRKARIGAIRIMNGLPRSRLMCSGFTDKNKITR